MIGVDVDGLTSEKIVISVSLRRDEHVRLPCVQCGLRVQWLHVGPTDGFNIVEHDDSSCVVRHPA